MKSRAIADEDGGLLIGAALSSAALIPSAASRAEGGGEAKRRIVGRADLLHHQFRAVRLVSCGNMRCRRRANFFSERASGNSRNLANAESDFREAQELANRAAERMARLESRKEPDCLRPADETVYQIGRIYDLAQETAARIKRDAELERLALTRGRAAPGARGSGRMPPDVSPASSWSRISKPTIRLACSRLRGEIERRGPPVKQFQSRQTLRARPAWACRAITRSSKAGAPNSSGWRGSSSRPRSPRNSNRPRSRHAALIERCGEDRGAARSELPAALVCGGARASWPDRRRSRDRRGLSDACSMSCWGARARR